MVSGALSSSSTTGGSTFSDDGQSTRPLKVPYSDYGKRAFQGTQSKCFPSCKETSPFTQDSSRLFPFSALALVQEKNINRIAALIAATLKAFHKANVTFSQLMWVTLWSRRRCARWIFQILMILLRNRRRALLFLNLGWALQPQRGLY